MKPVESNEKHNIKSSSYKVSRTTTTCNHCKKDTKVFGIILPENHEILQKLNENKYQWDNDTTETVYFNLKNISRPVLDKLLEISNGKFRYEINNENASEILTNHCQHCDQKLSENTLNSPPESGSDKYPFAYVTHSENLPPIFIKNIKEPFLATGSNWIIYSGCIIEGCL